MQINRLFRLPHLRIPTKMKYFAILTIFLIGCNNPQKNTSASETETNTDVPHTQHDEIIQQDLQNKQRELNLLREIRVAQQNDDEEAYQFFMEDFYQIPRLVLTEEQKKHPKFKEWIETSLITSGAFVDSKYDYIVNGQ